MRILRRSTKDKGLTLALCKECRSLLGYTEKDVRIVPDPADERFFMKIIGCKVCGSSIHIYYEDRDRRP
jgi:RNase P subunit RPR2